MKVKAEIVDVGISIDRPQVDLVSLAPAEGQDSVSVCPGRTLLDAEISEAIGTLAALLGVLAAVADERVGAVAAVQAVGAALAFQRIGNMLPVSTSLKLVPMTFSMLTSVSLGVCPVTPASPVTNETVWPALSRQ